MYVASVSFGCCKTRLGCCIYMQVFQVFLYICCKCFILMFTYICNGYTCIFKFFLCFASVSDVCCKCFSCFGRMLQVFYLDVAKVDRVLHMLQSCEKGRGRERSLRMVWQCRPHVGTRNVGLGWGCASRARETKYSVGVRVLALPIL
jgi:hypothetical protein